VGAAGALLSCGGRAAEPGTPTDPPVIEMSSEPPSEPPSQFDCTVEIERHGEQWEATAKGSSAEAARTASSRESFSGACLQAFRALCPDDICLGRVRSVGGLAVLRLPGLVTRGRHHPSPQVAATGASICDLELVFRGPEQRGEASDDVSGAPDMDALAEEARTAACRKLGIDQRRCADSDQVPTIGSSRQLQFVSGHSSATVKITVASERSVKVTGRGADRESACVAAVAEACRDQACAGASKLFVRTLDGVTLRPSVPKHLPREGVFGIGR
jgi:hypothetical protein